MRTAAIFITLILFSIAAALVWTPFETSETVYSTGLTRNKPAGQITNGFSLSQTIAPPKQNNAFITAPVDCFALRFATYMRENSGKIRVSWQQGGRSGQWMIDAGDLQDNSYVDFCLDSNFDTQREFKVDVQGIGGIPGKSATLWLTSASPGQAHIKGKGGVGLGMAFKLSSKQHLSLAEMIKLGHGAFALGWLCSLLTGILVLVYSYRSEASQTTGDQSNHA